MAPRPRHHEPVDCGALLRAVRHSRLLSQRDLALLAGVRHSTIDRIEAGRTRSPSMALMDRILRATGHALVVVDHHGRLLELDEQRERLFDRSGRRLPAHLPYFKVKWTSSWWGWSRIAWLPSDPAVPTWSYYRLVPSAMNCPEHIWMDAT